MMFFLHDPPDGNGFSCTCYSYPTLADLLDDAVVAEGATDEVSHCLGSQRAYGIAVRRANGIRKLQITKKTIIVPNYLKPDEVI